MQRMLRFTGVAAVVGALVFVSVAPASATERGSAVNIAPVVNTTNYHSAFRLAFSVKPIDGPTVFAANAALATASCTSCRTVGIAFQVVFVKTAAVARADNKAVAVSYRCKNCATLASAYQFVVVGGSPSLPSAIQPLLDRVGRDLSALNTSTLTLEQVQAGIDALGADVLAALVGPTSATRPQSAASAGNAPQVLVDRKADLKYA